ASSSGRSSTRYMAQEYFSSRSNGTSDGRLGLRTDHREIKTCENKDSFATIGSIKQLHKEVRSLSKRLMGKQCVHALRLRVPLGLSANVSTVTGAPQRHGMRPSSQLRGFFHSKQTMQPRRPAEQGWLPQRRIAKMQRRGQALSPMK